MSAVDKVRVILVGDSGKVNFGLIIFEFIRFNFQFQNKKGVGKTSLTHLLAHNETLTSPGWTVGCAVEVKLHEYKEGTPQQNTFFVELWDVGGSISHNNTRGVFYQPTHGIVLVHDLTNRKSHENLQKWLMEILNKDGKDVRTTIDCDFDPEQFLGSTQIPILVIGAKLDLLDDQQKQKVTQRTSGSIAEQCGADEIFLNCHDTRSLTAGTHNAMKLSRFFDKVIERRYFARDPTLFNDKRKIANQYTPSNSPFNSPYGSFINSTMIQ